MEGALNERKRYLLIRLFVHTNKVRLSAIHGGVKQSKYSFTVKTVRDICRFILKLSSNSCSNF